MAFNTGLKFVDIADNNRHSLTISESSQSFFESNTDSTAFGAFALTMRPAQGTANDKQTLVLGDNLAVGIQYNGDGSQYRLIIQDAPNYASSAWGTNTVSGSYAPVDVEATFVLNWNSNGSLSLAQTDESLRTLFMTPWTAEKNEIAVTVSAAADADDDYVILLDNGKGQIVEFGYNSASGESAASVATKLAAALPAGSGYTASASAAVVTFARDDGQSFVLKAGTQANLGFDGTNSSAELTVSGTAITTAAGAKGGALGMDANFEGFISQIAEFNGALSVSEMNTYVASPETIPDPVVGAPTSSKAVITVAAENSVKYQFTLDDGAGNKTAAITFTADSDATVPEINAGLLAAFTALADKKGFSLEAITNAAGTTTHFDVSRSDGADFVIDTTGSTYTGTEISVNGVGVAKDVTITSANVGDSSLAVVVGTAADDGKNYQLVLDDGDGNLTTVDAFNIDTTGSTAQTPIQTATKIATVINAIDGYGATNGATPTSTVTVSRSDGKAFSIKLGADDEVGTNLSVDGTALSKAVATVAKNSSQNGSTALITNDVKQRFDFSELDDDTSIVGAAPANYTGEATLSLVGLDKTDGVADAPLTGGSSFPVSSSPYTGAVVESSDGAVDSNAVYAQIRDVDGSSGTRTMVFDLFVDPQYVDTALNSLSYKVTLPSGLTIDSFSQLTAPGGYSLGSPSGSDIEVRWFSPTGELDLTVPVATISVTESSATNEPELTFQNIEVNGQDLADGTEYNATYKQVVAANLADVTGDLVSGLDDSTGSEGHYVLGTLAPGGTAASPTPISGLYLESGVWSATEGATSTMDANFDFDVKTASKLASKFEFEVKLPAKTDMATVVFVPTESLPADWAITTSEVQGRTLVVKASGTTEIASGASLGTVSVNVPSGFDQVHHFEMTDVQTNASAATENGRGLYAGITETGSDGSWALNDLPAGLFNRSYQDGPTITDLDVTAIDAFYALQVSAGLVPSWYASSVTDGQVYASDFDGSGKVTAADALAILNYVVGTEVADPDPVAYAFYDSASSTSPVPSAADTLKALTADMEITAGTDLDAARSDRVVLIGDLSDPSA